MNGKQSINPIILENEFCRLKVGGDCIVKSLVLKKTGEECLLPDEEIALFSVTQERPFNNEVKLAHPNRRTTFQANRLRREGDRLIVGFEITPFEAVISIREAPHYIAFTLEDFIVHPTDYGHLCMTPPPVAELRLVQLPVKHRANFGEWLNVCWDDAGAVNVLALSPHARIGSERRSRCRIMTADAVKGIRLRGCGAALIAAPREELLNAIGEIEEDYDLPRGVQSRRDKEHLNAGIYWTAGIQPANADRHIAFAQKGGFRMMLIYYRSIFREEGAYNFNGNYDFRPEFPGGMEDLKKLLQKIKAAGITPGFHFLHTHIGLRSRYVTPRADHRLHLTQRFTLSRPLGPGDGEVFVEEDPQDAPMHEKCRVLNFGGELIAYEGYTVERPYRFTGCRRGAYDTAVQEHPAGQIGGILDISEFGGGSVYLDQNSDLQDEIAARLAQIYDAGFEFVYFDGSEGTNAPFDFHVPNAQYRVYRQLGKAPLFTEGAAKAHFSWHFLSGGNAFDIFPPEIFKASIDRFPAQEAPRMRCDFTRLNFGWWGIWVPGTQPDHFEYGTSHAAGWDCPVSIQFDLEKLERHPRADDLLEVLRRWEDVREKGWLTEEQKRLLREPGKEYTLLINERNEYELVPCRQLPCGDERIRAFAFKRGVEQYAMFWHTQGEGTMTLPAPAEAMRFSSAFGGTWTAPGAGKNGEAVLPIGARQYLRGNLTQEELAAAFARATL